MRSQLRRLRGLFSVEVSLVLFVLIMAGAVQYQTQKTAELRTERTLVQRKFTQTQESLAALQDPAVLQKQIQELQAIPQSQTLPTRRDALAVSTALADYAAQSGLKIVAQSTADGTIPGAMEGEKIPTVNVAMEVEGPLAKLTGLLGVVNGFPTATVQSLEFSIGEDGVQHAKLGLVVAYRPTG